MVARRRTASASIVAALIGVSVLVAGPAAADEYELSTSGWDWIGVHDTALGISDAAAYHRDVLGSGLTLKGWTEDAFDAYENVDGYLSSLGFTHVNPGLSGVLAPVPVSQLPQPGGGMRIISEQLDLDLGDGAFLDVTVVLDIRGSFARWTITADDGGSGLVTGFFGSGEFGGPTSATNVGAGGLVVTGPSGLGPVVGLSVTSDGDSELFDGTDPEFPTFEASGATEMVVTVALLEYDPCGESAAIAQMTALVPDLESHFGTDLAPVFGECVTVGAPALLQAGQATDQLIPLTFSGALAGGHPRLDGDSYPDYIVDWTSGLAVLEDGLPNGLTLEIAGTPDAPALRLVGTPLLAFSGEVPLRFYGVRNDPAYSGEMPIAATLTLDIDGLDITNPDPDGDGGGGAGGGELPPTGPGDATGSLVAGAAVLVLGVLVRLASRPRRARAWLAHDPS